MRSYRRFSAFLLAMVLFVSILPTAALPEETIQLPSENGAVESEVTQTPLGTDGTGSETAQTPAPAQAGAAPGEETPATDDPAAQPPSASGDGAAETPDAGEKATDNSGAADTQSQRFVNAYAYLSAGTTVYADQTLKTTAGTLAARSVVYVFARDEKENESDDVLSIAYADAQGAATGYVRAKAARVLTDEEAAQFVKNQSGAFLYRANASLPLALITFELPDSGQDSSGAGAPLTTPDEQTASTLEPETPEKEEQTTTLTPENPEEKEQTTTLEPETPAGEEQTPALEPEIPAEEPDAPAAPPEIAAEEPAASVPEPETPAADAETLIPGIAANTAPQSVALMLDGKSVTAIELDLSHLATVLLTAAVLPETADQQVVYSSNNESVAKAGQDGTVTAVAPGTALISAHAASDERVLASVTVTVRRRVAAVVISGPDSVRGGGSVKLIAAITPSDAENASIAWSSSDETLAKVSQTGVVTAVQVAQPASVVIFAAAQDGSEATDSFALDILPSAKSLSVCANGEPVTKITLDLLTKETVLLSAVVSPEGAAQGVVWSLSRAGYASLDENNALTPLKTGYTDLVCTAADGSGVRSTVRVYIVTKLQAITISGAETLRAGLYTTLTALSLPENATNRTLLWSSSDPDAASVSSSGRVSARAVKEPVYVVITAAAADGSGLRAEHTIYIVPAAQSVDMQMNGESVSKATIDLTKGETSLRLDAVVLPAGADQGVVYSSSDKRVATVDETGLVTAHIPGSATITARAKDGTGRSDAVTVKVAYLVSGIEITGASDTLRGGKTLSLKARVEPAGASDASVVWSVSDKEVAAVSSGGRVSARYVSKTSSVTVTATARDGSQVYDEYELTVYPAAQSVQILGDGDEPVTSLAVDFTGDGQTLNLTARVLPLGAAQQVRWSSSDKRVAYVDEQTGAVTLHKRGRVYITARATDDSGRSVRLTLNVRTLATGIEISGFECLGSGCSGYLKAVVSPSDVTVDDVIWSTQNTDLISVSSGGRVRANKVTEEKNVTVRATADDGSGVYSDYSFILLPAVSALSIQNDKGETITGLTLDAGDDTMNTASLAALVTPDGAWRKVTWKTSSAAVAGVDQTGLVTALKNGRATITATAADGSGRSKRITVNVITRVKEIVLSGVTSVAAGKSASLTVQVYPLTASNKNLTFVSSDPQAATVSSDGRITAKPSDEIKYVTITATAQDGGGASQSLLITVTPPVKQAHILLAGNEVTRETLDVQIVTDEYGQAVEPTLALSAAFDPADAGQTAQWKSSNAAVASVTQDGLVTGHKTGVAYITATATDGTRVYAGLNVRVRVPVNYIEITGVTALAKGRSAMLKASVLPLNASDDSVVWSSLNPDVISVTSYGRITALQSSGTAAIMAAAKDGSQVYGVLNVAACPPAADMKIRYLLSASSSLMGEGNGALPVPVNGNGEAVTANAFDDEAQIAASTVTLWANDYSTVCLKAVVTPDGASQNVRFTSSNPAVATVFELTPDEQKTAGYAAYLQVYRRGSSVITATSTDGTSLRRTFTLIVNQRVEEIEITGDTYLVSGQSTRLRAAVVPSTATTVSVLWGLDTSDPAIDYSQYAAVSASGLVTAKAVSVPTEIIVTATARDGSGVVGYYHMMLYPTQADVPSANATYRALVVVEPTDTKYGVLKRTSDLNGIAAMLRMQRFDGRAFDSVRTMHQTSAGAVLTAISGLAGQTTDADITYFYFLGHGASDGTLIFYDGSSMTAATLKNALDGLKGRVVVFLANCFSGYYIASGSGENAVSALSFAGDASSDDQEVTNAPPSAFCSSVISVFSQGDAEVVLPFSAGVRAVSANIGELRKSKYYVLTASLYNESSWFNYYFDETGISESKSFDRYTRGLYRTGGWDEIEQSATWSAGKSVTLAQAYSQVRTYVNSFTDVQSSVQVYPSSSSFVIFQH